MSIEKQISSISLKSPMINYLKSKGVIFDNNHRAYDLIHCENRVEHNPKCCEHCLMDLHCKHFNYYMKKEVKN